jgi:hypothetical protein
MLLVESNYPGASSTEIRGFVDRTTFEFTILSSALLSPYTLSRVRWDFGYPKAKPSWTNGLTINNITFPIEGIFKVKATVYYSQRVIKRGRASTVNRTAVFTETLNIKKFPVDFFKLDKTEGFARLTQFSLTPVFDVFATDTSEIKYVQWDLGNGVVSNRKTLSPIYNEPGIFTIHMIGYTRDGIKFEQRKNITIKEYLNESIKFTQVPPPTFAGHINRYPFKIEITSTNELPHIVDLYAQFSRSYPMEVDKPHKNAFLRPQWRFLDLNGRPIRFIRTKDTRVRVNREGKEDPNGVVVGVRGTAEFYFVDDWYNMDQVTNGQQYTTLWATLRTDNIRLNQFKNNLDSLHPGFANSTAQAFCPYVTIWRKPDIIRFTSNGINNINNVQWKNAKIPFIAKLDFNNYYDYWPDGNIIDQADRGPGKIRASSGIFTSLLSVTGQPSNPSGGSLAHYALLNENENTTLNLGYSGQSERFFTLPLSTSPEPILKYKDENDLLTGGYHKGLLNTAHTGTIVLTAKATLREPILLGEHFNSLIWIPNPVAGTLNITQYIATNNAIINNPQYFYSQALDTYNEFFTERRLIKNAVKKNPNLDQALVSPYNFPTIRNRSEKSIYNVKGLNGLRAIAATTIPNYHAWAADTELNLIYRVAGNGKILSTLNLPRLFSSRNLPFNDKFQRLTPNWLTLDKDHNLFVSLLNGQYILKFNNQGKYITSLNLKSYNLKPICIETDKSGNLFISAVPTSPTSSYRGTLVRVDNNLQNYTLLHNYNLPTGEITIDINDNVYLVVGGQIEGNRETYYPSNQYISGNILRYTKNNLTKIDRKFGPYRDIQHITTDNRQNIWFACDYDTVVKIDIRSLKPFTRKINATAESTRSKVKINKNAIEGIAYSLNNKIYVLNSVDNQVIVLNASNANIENVFYINPGNFQYSLDEYNVPKTKEYKPFAKSLRASGDWTGWKWANKYAYRVGLQNYNVEGKSNILSFFNHNSHKIFQVNENFDMAQHMYSLAFMPSLKESPFLFSNKTDLQLRSELLTAANEVRRYLEALIEDAYDTQNDELIKSVESYEESLEEVYRQIDQIKSINNRNVKGFLGSIFGTYPLSPNSLGTEIYVKIANYVANFSDPETAQIKQLYNLENLLDIQTEDAKIYFPSGLQRIVDVCSVDLTKLLGTRCRCNEMFVDTRNKLGNNKCPYCGQEKEFNLGKIISSNNYIVTAGVPLILRIKNLDQFRYISTGPINSSNYYTLTDLATSIGLVKEAWPINYEFYEFKKPYSDWRFYKGKPLLSETYTVTANTPVILQDLRADVYSFVPTFKLNRKRFYSLTDLIGSIEGINPTNWQRFYRFYSYDTNNINANVDPDKNIIESVIDWDNPQTTLTRKTSSVNAWYRDNGLIDRMVNFELQKGLGYI